MGLISSIEERNSNQKDQDLPEGIIVENIHDIGLVENFFTKDECKKFIDLYDKAKQLNLTFNRQEGEKIPSTMKQDETYSPFGDCYVMERLFDPKLLNLFLSRFWKVYERYVSEYGDVMGGYGHQINALRVQETQIGGGIIYGIMNPSIDMQIDSQPSWSISMMFRKAVKLNFFGSISGSSLKLVICSSGLLDTPTCIEGTLQSVTKR